VTDEQLLRARTWEAGFDAGVQNSFGNPAMANRDLRMLWRAAWMSGRKCIPLIRNTMDEHLHQTMLFRWAEAAVVVLPELGLMYAVPNGGKRDPVTAAKLKQEGVKAGVPDICLPVPRCGWAALYVEMKVPKGRVMPDQANWMEQLQREGNLALPCFGWQSARRTIAEYLMEAQ